MPVIELGGCLGIISALIRQQVGPTPRHIVVEASDRLAHYCRANATLGAAEGATEIVVAAVDYSGAASVSFATGRMAHSGRVAASGGMSVPTTTLSRLAATLPDGSFALVCDIEGAEVPMITHEMALLSRVAVMVLETHPKLYPGGKADMEALVAQIEKTGLRRVAQAANVFAFSRA
jgi:FkbM family methyltransferase